MLKLLFSSYTYWTLHHEIPFISGEFLAHLYYLKHSFVLVSTVRFLFLSPCSSCLTHSRCVSHLCLTSCHHHHCHSHDCHCHHLHLVPVSDDRSAVSHMVVSVITFSLGCFQVCLNVYSTPARVSQLNGGCPVIQRLSGSFHQPSPRSASVVSRSQPKHFSSHMNVVSAQGPSRWEL